MSFDDLVRVDACFWCLSFLVLAVVPVVLTMECACADSLCCHGVDELRAYCSSCRTRSSSSSSST